MSAMPQQQNMMQNSEGPHALLNMESERQFIREKIFNYIMLRQTREMTPQVMDIARRLEEGLFKIAATKEDYLNLDTLESRLHALIKHPPPESTISATK
ncbi:putative histone acetyltransferase [Helianthus debilis subsp. tardiflorus]